MDLFLNLWLDYLVCHTKYLVFLSLQMDIGNEVSPNVYKVGYAAVFTDICSSWKSFLFKRRKVIWPHPLENVLKSGLGKLWYITPCLKPRTLSELLFIPERFAEHFTEFCHSHFTHVYPSGWLSNCFLHFHTSTMTPLLNKTEKKWKSGKKIKKGESDEAHLFEWVSAARIA